MLVFKQERGSGYANACSFIQVSQKHQASLLRNQTMKTELSAANAIYEFLLDLIEVQRAVAKFDFFLKANEREAWYERIESYFQGRMAGFQNA